MKDEDEKEEAKENEDEDNTTRRRWNERKTGIRGEYKRTDEGRNISMGKGKLFVACKGVSACKGCKHSSRGGGGGRRGGVCLSVVTEGPISELEEGTGCQEKVEAKIVKEPIFKRGLENDFVQHPLHTLFATSVSLGDVSGTFLTLMYSRIVVSLKSYSQISTRGCGR